METKANYVLVGLFTLVAILAAFGFVYWTAQFGERGETAPLRVRIPGSASGLARGSGVFFNGIRVGDVVRVYIDVKDPTLALADTEVDRLTPITRSTKADIGIAGLTGQANIELRGAALNEPKLLDEAEEQGKVAEITANPSAVTNLLQTAQDIFKRADTVLSELEGFVRDVRDPLTKTIDNAEKFSEALSNNADGVDDFLASVTKLSDQLASASDKLDSTLDAAEGLIRSVDKEQVKQIVGNVQTLTENLRETSGKIDGVVGDVDRAVASITEFSDGARQTLGKVDKIIDGIDPGELRDTIKNIETYRGYLSQLADPRSLSEAQAQEIIARAHYRGRVKRRMQAFVSNDAQQIAPGERLAILAHCWSGWAYAWASPYDPGREVEEKGLVYRTLAHPIGLERATFWIFVASGVVAAALLVRKRVREGRLPIATPLVALVCSVWAWSIWSSVDPLVRYVIPALHSVQYLYFVWLLRAPEAREREGPPHFETSAKVRLGVLAVSALGLGWLLFHGAPTALDDLFTPRRSRFTDMGPTPYFAALYAFVNIHHYLMDSVVWRRENPETRWLQR